MRDDPGMCVCVKEQKNASYRKTEGRCMSSEG